MSFLIGLLIVLAVLCLGYYLAAASYAGFGASFLGFWLVLAMLLLLVAVLLIFHKKYQILFLIPKAIRIIFMMLLICGILFFGVMEGLVLSGTGAQADECREYVIVLGAQVRGTRITKLLAQRIDAAYEYLENNPECLVVCTGGQGTGEDISEAEAIKGRLIELGIDENRILVEDKSRTTYENLKFALDIIGDKDAKVAVVTNSFHAYRAKLLAERVGFTDAQAIAGETKAVLFLNYVVREGFALAKELVFGN